MKFRKNLIAGAIAACIAPAAYADIELGSGLSVTGFLDMSYTNVDEEGAPGSERSLGIDQFEVDFLWSGSNGISAQVDIEYGESSAGGPGEDDTFVEQAFVTKAFTDKFSMKFGRFLSYTGWETEEPTGLYQYSSTGYGAFFYGGYQQGVSAYYDGGVISVMGSVFTDAFDPLDRDSDPDGEIGIAISPGEGNFTAKLFAIEADEDDIVDLWASYTFGNVTLAAEYVTRDYDGGDEGKGHLLMVNYAPSNWGITFRYHAYDFEDTTGVKYYDTKGITISPSYKVGDNLLLVAEYRKDEINDTDVDTIALEALFMF